MKLNLLLGALVLGTSLTAQAASISTYRIYLDSDHRQQKFQVRNTSNLAEQCTLSYKYRQYDGNGGLTDLSEAQQNELSEQALKRVRFSPSSFTLEPKSVQNIAFSYRRLVNDDTAEYRTYAAVRCQKIGEDKAEGSMSAALELVVPMVIRTGKLQQLNANIQKRIISDNQASLKVRLEHSGNRSVYGDIKLVDTAGTVQHVIRKNAVIYPDMKFLEVDIPKQYLTQDNMQLQFIEKGDYNDNRTFTFTL